MFVIFLGKFYASFDAAEFILKMPCLPIAIFLSFENPPIDSLHLRETLRQPRIEFRIAKFEVRNFPTLRLQASVVSPRNLEEP
jgi:hypothetical protein